MQLARYIALCLFLSLLAATAWAGEIPPTPLPVAYVIDARVDVTHMTLDATEVLRYHNFTGQPQDRFPFHLYLNAFQPESTFMQEVRRDIGGGRFVFANFQWEEKWRGAEEIKSFVVPGVGDLTAQIHFIHPDDDNANDRTVFEVRLPHPVPPDGEVEFRIQFHDKFPEIFARTGYKRDFIMGGQWFPKVGVWWKNAWNCHQFHEMTEFFADFGIFDVKLTLPQNYVVGASGVETGAVDHADGTTTHQFHAAVIHDFAWTACPHFHVINDTFTGSAGKVNIRLLIEPSHLSSARRYLSAVKGTMRRFDEWYGPYPYPQITLVDPPHGAGRAGGMEYPTLITLATAWWMPKGLLVPEMVTEHEFGHQYWYGMVATNEFEEAWLDEGINSYTEVKIMDSLYGKDTSMVNLAGMTVGEAESQWMSYVSLPDTDPIARFAWQFMTRSAYSGITYGKTASMLLTLEKVVGEDTLRRALHVYFMRYRFTHPTGEDFLRTLEEVAGRDLRWYFDQAVYGTAVLDYEVFNIASDRPDWAREKGREKSRKDDPNAVYNSTVLVRRKGEFVFPVEVLAKFSSGPPAHEHWDGRDRWIRYTYSRPGKIVSAEVDPERAIWLDKDFFNNSHTAAPNAAATHKLANCWMFVTQWLAQWLAWLA
jgi:hypothetical protein